jgi:hypothetical protein
VIHNIINSIRSKEELPDQCKESVNVPIHKKDNKTDCSNCPGISRKTFFLSFMVKSKYKLNYWGPSVWIST